MDGSLTTAEQLRLEEQELLKEFLTEAAENLARLDEEMVQLEQDAENAQLIGSIFRAMHTIKGGCGIFGFARLETVAHKAEHILSELRDGKRTLNAGLAGLILDSSDAMKRILSCIAQDNNEGEPFESELLARLDLALQSKDEVLSKPAPTGAPTEVAATERSNLPPSLRVDVSVLDELLNLVGELVLTKNQLSQYEERSDRERDEELESIAQRLALITTELQDGVMRTRMQSVGTLWSKLPRMVRDLSATLGKSIKLEISGADTELDRTIIEAIKDPLMHIVRNACDHGIETTAARLARGKPLQGKLSLTAFHEAGQVTIEISDDGGGIDPATVKTKAIERGLLSEQAAHFASDHEIINLVLLPGFSTAKTVTNISGRGVGMDVVKTNIERVGGSVELVSRLGYGTTVKMKVPLSLAIVPGLMVETGGHLFAIPQVNLQEVVKLDAEHSANAIETINGLKFYRYRGELIALLDLNRALALPVEKRNCLNLAIVMAEGRHFGLLVDRIHATQEIVVKPLAPHLNGIGEYIGATVMGDGRLALILDIQEIGKQWGALSPRQAASPASEPKDFASEDHQPMLIFKCGEFERIGISLDVVERVEKVPASKIGKAAGRPVMEFQDELLPLLQVAQVLDTSTAMGESLVIIVCREGSRKVGLIVERIVEVSAGDLSRALPSIRPGIKGTVMRDGRMLDILDLEFALSTMKARSEAIPMKVASAAVRSEMEISA